MSTSRPPEMEGRLSSTALVEIASDFEMTRKINIAAHFMQYLDAGVKNFLVHPDDVQNWFRQYGSALQFLLDPDSLEKRERLLRKYGNLQIFAPDALRAMAVKVLAGLDLDEERLEALRKLALTEVGPVMTEVRAAVAATGVTTT